MRPMYFASGGESLFGWLHPPADAVRSDIGLVLCKPFGYESVCAHAALRAFADACAAIGVTVLRFDYSATGDSSGGDGDHDQIADWTRDVEAAVDAVRRQTGVRRVCLLGVRLGAMLAALAAARCGVEGFIAVAPVVDGRRYLRELRAYRAAAVQVAARDATDGSLEVTGFTLSSRSVDSLARTNLHDLATPAAVSALILDRSDLPGAKSWADMLLGRGADLRYRCLPGFAEMVTTPHESTTPHELIAAVVEWLRRFQPEGAAQSPEWRQPPPADPRERVAFALAGPAVVTEASMRVTAAEGIVLLERATFIDADRTLFAVITAPDLAPGSSPARHGVVMLNGGATSHIGPNRMYVELARRWAARGYVVLRLDLAGIGDSATRPGRTGNEVYPPGALDDISAAIDFLRRAYAVEDITLAGLCAGAYHALTSARAGLPVNTVLMVNPLTFYWKQGAKLNDLQISEVIRNPGIYAERVFAPNAWLKLLRGRVNLWRVVMVFLRRAWLSVESRLRDVARQLRIRISDDLGWDLHSVASRGVRMVFLFARGDGGADLLKVQGGAAVAALGERCRIHMIDDADHIFSQGDARRQLVQLMSEELPK